MPHVKRKWRDVKMEMMDTAMYPKKVHNSYEDEEERKHFQRIIHAFRYYK